MPVTHVHRAATHVAACTAESSAAIPALRASAAVLPRFASPHVTFSVAIWAISCCTPRGIRGRPTGRDLQRQNKRKPFRCHRMSVPGFTTVRRRRQSTSTDRATSVIRVASSARHGFTCRSTYSASCFLRNRFSAESAHATAARAPPAVRCRRRRAGQFGRRCGTGTESCPRIVRDTTRATIRSVCDCRSPDSARRHQLTQICPDGIFADHRQLTVKGFSALRPA
jgi:hypothetical protein